jgi:hypothetical protein
MVWRFRKYIRAVACQSERQAAVFVELWRITFKKCPNKVIPRPDLLLQPLVRRIRSDSIHEERYYLVSNVSLQS